MDAMNGFQPGCCVDPADSYRKPSVTFTTAGDQRRPDNQASHGLIARLDELAARRGFELIYSIGWVPVERERAALRLVPDQAWQIAIDARGQIR
jgi:hypothetical protein